ncbi:MAG: penicillin acylase family protein [Spirochaetes bacterium]|nr:penicillin acylase family protein [Spirochaetota bacterium]HOD15165.1 penicillin acylase family protein [Spirochaetota bacterium]
MKKKLIIAGICAAAIALTVAAVLLVNHYRGRISYAGTTRGAVTADVVLERDINGTPLVQAKNFEDVYFAIGYLHAQDRYGQMEYFRAIAAAETGDIAGADGPALGRLSRAIGFMDRARDIMKLVKEPYASYLKAYAHGVNTARADLRLANMVARDWAPEDGIAILLLREWSNAFLNNRETIFQFSREESSAGLKDIIPENLIYFFPEDEADCVEAVRKIKKLVKNRIGAFNRGYAFYLPAQKVKERYPVTAFSCEDPLPLYPGWYPLHVNTPDRIIKGITHAGIPFIFSGTNLDIAFYAFTLNLDAQDFIAIPIVRSGDTYQYLGAAGWLDFERPGGAGAVRVTEHGPLLNDVYENREYGSFVVTVRSVVFGEDYIASLFGIPVAKSIEEAGALVKNVRSFPRVYLFGADDAALRAWSGQVPSRTKTDSVLRHGADAAWTGMTELSAFSERTDGAVAAGSSFTADAPAAVRENAIIDDERSGRLNALLDRKKRFAGQDVENVLADTYSPFAGLFLPEFLSILGDNPVASSRLARIYFQNWDGRMDPGSVAPSLFYMLLGRFMSEAYGDDLKDMTGDGMERWDLLVPQFYTILREGGSPRFDDTATFSRETRDTIFDRAFLKTMRWFNRGSGPVMDEWKWGALHRGRYAIPGLKSGEEDEVLPVPLGGSCDTLLLGVPGTGLETETATSLSGFFGIDTSLIFMNYSYSTDPRSGFYYGETKRLGTSSFHEVYGEYFLTVKPEKK